MKNNAIIDIGINSQSELISIREVFSGRTDLCCPICKYPLIARKGKTLQHHFAHDTGKDPNPKTCKGYILFDSPVSRQTYDTLFDFVFHELRWQRRTLAQKEELYNATNGGLAEKITKIPQANFQQEIEKGLGFLKRISNGKATNQVQNAKILQRFEDFLEGRTQEIPDFRFLKSSKISKWITAKKIDSIPAEHREYADDIEIIWANRWKTVQDVQQYASFMMPVELFNTYIIAKYQIGNQREKLVAWTELQEFQVLLAQRSKFKLYFLKINDGEAYKIGITSRDIEDRVSELRNAKNQKIQTLRVMGNCGFVESYFKRHYAKKQNNEWLVNCTEYFKFNNDEEREITQQLDKIDYFVNNLSQIETDIQNYIGRMVKHLHEYLKIETYDATEMKFKGNKIQIGRERLETFTFPLSVYEDIPEFMVWDTEQKKIESDYKTWHTFTTETIKKIKDLRDRHNNIELMEQLNQLFK